MRLENKMNKWLKFIIKLFPFVWFFFVFVFAIGSSSDSGSFVSEILSLINDESLYEFLINAFNDFSLNTPFSFLNEMSFGIFSNFNNFVIENILLIDIADGHGGVANTILSLFEYWLIIDLIDLVFSAFRFFIDICRSWLDSFYDKNKGGYK